MAAHHSSNTNALRRLIVGYRVSQALSVVARLGIADLLSDGPKSIDNLAAATHTHARSLYRLLRVLASEGVFTEQGDGHFVLTSLAESLRSNAPDSLQTRAIFDGAEGNWHAWGNLLKSVQSGEPAIKHSFGKDLFGYLRDHPYEAKLFNEVMAAQTPTAARAVLEAYDFSGIDTLVDIGGGVGLASCWRLFCVLIHRCAVSCMTSHTSSLTHNRGSPPQASRIAARQ